MVRQRWLPCLISRIQATRRAKNIPINHSFPTRIIPCHQGILYDCRQEDVVCKEKKSNGEKSRPGEPPLKSSAGHTSKKKGRGCAKCAKDSCCGSSALTSFHSDLTHAQQHFCAACLAPVTHAARWGHVRCKPSPSCWLGPMSSRTPQVKAGSLHLRYNP